MIGATLVLCLSTPECQSTTRRPRKRRVTAALVVTVIKGLNPQARRRGWRWRHEYRRYYRPSRLRNYARWILASARRYRQDPWYIVAILQEQSRFHYDAVSRTRDYGLSQIHCGKRSPWCRYPPTRRQKRRLLNPKWSIETLGKWLVGKQQLCRGAIPKSGLAERCRRNRRLTGVSGTLGHPHKTQRILLKIRRILDRKRP